MSELFSCKDSSGRAIFNIVFFSVIGAIVLFLLALGGYLLYKRYKKAQKLKRLYKSRSNSNPHMNTNSTVLSAGSSTSHFHSAGNNFILGRPPATDVVLGIYGDEISKNARATFYEEKGWKGFAY